MLKCSLEYTVGNSHDVIGNFSSIRFFCMLGTVFGFVGSDVKAKVEILQEYREGPNKHNYETVEKMLHFEKSTGIMESNRLSSGSRTFLRLHRALGKDK